MSEINFPIIANCPGTLASGFSVKTKKTNERITLHITIQYPCI
jgi:hypothetical protein